MSRGLNNAQGDSVPGGGDYKGKGWEVGKSLASGGWCSWEGSEPGKDGRGEGHTDSTEVVRGTAAVGHGGGLN